MANTLEACVEEVVIDLIKLRPELPVGFSVVHHDEDARAKGNRIVVTAVCGEQQREGARAFAVEVTAEARMTEKSAANLDAVFKAVEDAIHEEPAIPPASAGAFLVFITDEEASNDRGGGKSSRSRSRTFSLKAKLKP